jgi:hypothetical protein
MILSAVMFALVGKLLAFVILGPIVIIALLAYIVMGKAKK